MRSISQGRLISTIHGDCRPYFSTASLEDPETLERHVSWYIEITQKHRPDISEEEISRRAAELRSNPDFLRSKIREFSGGGSRKIGEGAH